MNKPTREEALKEAYEIGTFVLNQLRKKTTDKMILDLINNYEEPIRNIIDETILATIERFDLKKATELYDEIEKKAEEIAEKDVESWKRSHRSSFSPRERHEYYIRRKDLHLKTMLGLNMKK